MKSVKVINAYNIRKKRTRKMYIWIRGNVSFFRKKVIRTNWLYTNWKWHASQKGKENVYRIGKTQTRITEKYQVYEFKNVYALNREMELYTFSYCTTLCLRCVPKRNILLCLFNTFLDQNYFRYFTTLHV